MALPVTLTNGPSWVDVGILITQVLTVVAAAGAYFAIRRQIRDSERHHREQLHASLRPLVVVEEARIVVSDGGQYIEVTVANAGSGPANHVEVTGWLGYLPPALPGVEARVYMDRVDHTVDLDTPELSLRLGAMGAGSSRTENLTMAPHVQRPPDPGFLTYLVTYTDQFENKFPTKPRAQWFAGHVLLKS